MKLSGLHFSLLGILLGILVFELWHKQAKGSW